MLLVKAHSTPISNKNVVLVQAVHHEMLVDSLPAIWLSGVLWLPQMSSVTATAVMYFHFRYYLPDHQTPYVHAGMTALRIQMFKEKLLRFHALLCSSTATRSPSSVLKFFQPHWSIRSEICYTPLPVLLQLYQRVTSDPPALPRTDPQLFKAMGNFLKTTTTTGLSISICSSGCCVNGSHTTASCNLQGRAKLWEEGLKKGVFVPRCYFTFKF